MKPLSNTTHTGMVILCVVVGLYLDREACFPRVGTLQLSRTSGVHGVFAIEDVDEGRVIAEIRISPNDPREVIPVRVLSGKTLRIFPWDADAQRFFAGTDPYRPTVEANGVTTVTLRTVPE